jgi:hypothetical protein
MFCSKCGKQNNDNVTFCTGCGNPMNNTDANGGNQQNQSPPIQPQPQAQQQTQQYQQQPQYQQQQPPPQYAQNAYQQPMYMPKKKSRAGLWIFIILLVGIVGAGAYFIGSLFGPKDLKVKYAATDFNNLMTKLGITIEANGIDPTAEDLDINDYNWTFTDYKERNIEITQGEAMAFFNEIAPPFWWFKDTQIKVDDDGKILTSSSMDIDGILNDLYPDVSEYIPIPLPKKANLYTEGDFRIENNQIKMDPETIKLGNIKIPETYLQGENLEVFSDELGRFIELIPGLDIKSAYLKPNGSFQFNAVIPTKITVTPK